MRWHIQRKSRERGHAEPWTSSMRSRPNATRISPCSREGFRNVLVQTKSLTGLSAHEPASTLPEVRGEIEERSDKEIRLLLLDEVAAIGYEHRLEPRLDVCK